LEEVARHPATQDSQDKDGIAVPHATGVFPGGDIEALVQSSLDVPAFRNEAQDSSQARSGCISMLLMEWSVSAL
jgi:hypothetical protein